jgi:hypothetical protein
MKNQPVFIPNIPKLPKILDKSELNILMSNVHEKARCVIDAAPPEVRFYVKHVIQTYELEMVKGLEDFV